MGGLLDLIDEEANKVEPREEEPTILTLGDLVRQARKDGIKPGEHEGVKYYTMVLKDGKLHIETTTEKDFQGLKARGKL